MINKITALLFPDFLNLVPLSWVMPLTLICWLITIYAFWRLGDNFPILSARHGIFSMQQAISRVGVVGVTGDFTYTCRSCHNRAISRLFFEKIG